MLNILTLALFQIASLTSSAAHVQAQPSSATATCLAGGGGWGNDVAAAGGGGWGNDVAAAGGGGWGNDVA